MKTISNDNPLDGYSSIKTINITIQNMKSLYLAYSNAKVKNYQYAALDDLDLQDNLFLSQTEILRKGSFSNVSGLENVSPTKTKTNAGVSQFDTVLSSNQQVNWKISYDSSSGDQAEISYILFDYACADVKKAFYLMPECYVELCNNQPRLFFRAYTHKIEMTIQKKMKYRIYLRLVYQGTEFRIFFDPLIQTRKSQTRK